MPRVSKPQAFDFRQVSANDNKEDRKRTLEAFRHGKFPGIVSVDVLAKGIDFPDVLCIIIARPYRKAIRGAYSNARAWDAHGGR